MDYKWSREICCASSLRSREGLQRKSFLKRNKVKFKKDCSEKPDGATQHELKTQNAMAPARPKEKA